MAKIRDVVVVGAGSGGFSAAVRAAQLGGSVTLIEASLHGGNCMNRACIPSKVLMRAAHLVADMGTAERYGIRGAEPLIDLGVLHERKDLLIESLRMGTEQLLAERGIHLIVGRARLAATDTVEVNGERKRAGNIILATGSIPCQAPIEGADLPGVLGTNEAMELREIPKRIAILGSQSWEIELAQYFHTLGSDITLIEGGPQLLPGADHEIAQRLGKLFHDSGITIRRNVGIAAIHQRPAGELALDLTEGEQLAVDRVLTDRRIPYSAGLGLRQVGVRTRSGAVVVNERMETSVPGVYAVGDLAIGANRSRDVGSLTMWSHKANAEGIVAAENAMGQSSRMDYDAIPVCLYTRPEIAWVGATEELAEADGLEVRIGKVPSAINPYAMILDQTEGMIKVIADRKYGKILGAHMMAPGAVELINAVSIAMHAEATVGELMRFVPAHPGIGEALLDAAMDVEGRSLHVPDW